MSSTEFILRGGGCGFYKTNSRNSRVLISDDHELQNSFKKFKFYIDQVCTKAEIAAVSSESQEIMIALQWFIFQEENIYKLLKNSSKVTKLYDLILEGIRKLMKSCLIYIRTDSFKCLYILQTISSLSKVIFSFHVMNENRFMKFDLKQELLDISDELKKHFEIEKNDLIQNQMELYLFLTKTSFQIAPNNHNKRKEILLGCLGGIFSSMIQMKPNEELLESLLNGADLLKKQYAISNNKKLFEVYFQLDVLQWEIIHYFRNEQLSNFDEIIIKIEDVYDKIVKNSNEWKYHYLWVQMVGKILQYNPLLTKHKLSQLINVFNLGGNSDQIWKVYLRKRFLIEMNHSNDQAIIQLDQLQHNQLSQIDRTVLDTHFKEWEIFLQLKDFLINEQLQNIPFTFGSYLNNKLQIQRREPEKNETILPIQKIKRFLRFLIPSKLLALIKQIDEMLDEVIKICKKFMINNQFNESTKFKISLQQIKKIIQKLEDYFQKIQDIIKIMSLNQNNQQETIVNNNFEKLNNLLRLQEIFQLFIISVERNQTQHLNGIDNNNVIQDLIKFTLENLTHNELREFNLSFLDQLTTKNCKTKMYEEAEKLNKIYNIEIDRIGHGHKLLSYFQNQVNQLYSYYVNKNDELQQHFNDLPLKEIILIKFQLETITSIEDLNKIKLAFFDRNFLKYFEILRQKNLTLQLKLVTTKKSFQMILQKVSREEQRMFLDVLKFEEFLLNVITNVPKRLMRENTNFDLPLHTELQNLQISYEDFKQKLPKQKGAITYLIIRQKINEKKIDSQRKDLELIEKELGELFIKEPSFLFVDKFQTIFEGLNVDEQLRVDTFNLPEKEKYKKFLYQLKQIENLRKCQQINNWNSLIIQTETVIEAIETFGQTDKEIDKMLIHEDLIMLKENIYKVFKEEQELIPISQNQIILEREEIRDDQSYRTYLQFMIKIVKLKKLQLLEELEFLNKLLEKFDSFSRKLDKILRYEEEYQNKLYFRFQDCTKECIQRFEESQLINDNVNQKEDENFQQYLERIETQFFRRGNVNVIYQAQIKISDFLNQIVACVKQVEFKYCTSTQIESDYLIQQLNTIYLEDIEVLEDEEESDQQLGLSNNLIFKIKDVITNDQWKIKQGLVFTIIQITSSCYSDTITSFCQKVLIQLWVQEKDQRVRNLLKNQQLLSIQMQILQKDWSNQHDRIAKNMQEMLRRVDELQEQISHEANLNKRDLYLKELNETIEQLDQQIENISEMGQQLRLIIDFVNHIRKGLIRVEGKINEMKEQLNNIDYDQKFLRGKSVEQLFEIRKWKVLKEAAYKNAKSIYVPLETKEIYNQAIMKKEDKLSILINLEEINDSNAEVNEFLLDEKNTVLLIHGVAGSGKSTTAKKIEEFIWKLHNKNKKIRNQILIPVYISLPTLKNPLFQAVEEALHQDEYGFDELQIKECKEMLDKKVFRFLLIMDSYDEMKLENIQKNLYMNNKVKQNWSDPLVIFTTRSEIFTSSNYAFWFAPDNKENLKEIQLQKFNPNQLKEYLKKFTIQSVKMLIFEIYERQTQSSNGQGQDINNFEISWEILQEKCLSLEFNGEVLLNQKQIEDILSFLKDNQFFSLKSNEALRSLRVQLQKLWSVEKYKKMMEQINLHRLVETPQMMEIIVQVLPQMMAKASEMVNLRQNFLKNFPKMLHEFYKSNYLIQMHNRQSKQYIEQDNNETEQQVIVKQSFLKILF